MSVAAERVAGSPASGAPGSLARWWQAALAPRAVAWMLLGAGAAALFLAGTGYRYAALGVTPGRPAVELAAGGGAPVASPVGLQAEGRRVSAEMARVTPSGVYIVIDRANNRLDLKRGEETLLEARCSAGSGSVLRDPAGNRRWVFDTPSGVFQVRSKKANPVWRKPDWAFIEEGRPIPSDPGARFEYGVLGEYALDLGDGYLIHGTLYERLLGRSVTHGCIRLGRDDLRRVYHAARLGTPVYIF